ncbi:heterogeneous nuclear ribonucleoprotein U-like protein 2 [Engraulis encrasicolus]|uniref:heterogeneous nuclear ribonucleoprotein U-like protein 2 n=1 Tax=Engraulis encrasicolus TaxID=184585 RepID=UPI002FD3C92D
MSGQPLLWERFPLLWSGCRLSHGVHSGKVSFEVKYVQRLVSSSQEEWRKLDAEPCVLRVGWSTDETSLQLGETEGSYAFDSRGRKVNKGRREDFGEPFSEGDIIGCYAWVKDSGQSELSFFKNGRPLGVAFRLPASRLKGRTLYPHVLCKNCSVSLNLDPLGSPPWYQGPIGFTPLHTLQPHQRSAAPRPPPSREECEVVLMVGLPGVGKSHWAQAHLAQHPEKRYTLLGTDALMACMRTTEVESDATRQLVLQQATQCVTELIREAAGRRGNYILDQANVYASARRHKMLLFSGFRRRAVVVFPSEQDWNARRVQQQRERGSAMTQENLLKIKVSFTLPEVGDLLEEVVFTERPREEAQRLLAAYKEEAREVLPTPPKRKKQKYKHKPNHCRPPAHGWKTWNAPYRRDPGWTGPPPPVPSPYWGPPSCTRQDMYDPMRPRNCYGCYGSQWNAFYGATAPFVDRSNTALAYW